MLIKFTIVIFSQKKLTTHSIHKIFTLISNIPKSREKQLYIIIFLFFIFSLTFEKLNCEKEINYFFE